MNMNFKLEVKIMYFEYFINKFYHINYIKYYTIIQYNT